MSGDRRSFDEQLRTAPPRPGCYLFRDRQDRVLYVGKARDLHHRVQVYRRHGADGRSRLAVLLEQARHAEWCVTSNEREAILLEDRLVKEFQPPLNVLLKDDKSFLLLRIQEGAPWPRLSLSRHRRGGGRFFGPYPSSGAARRAKRLLQRAFGLRDCSDHTLNHRSRPCLKHAVGLCSAPCTGEINTADYQDAVAGATRVLEGQIAPLLAQEKARMEQASAAQEYEAALRSRDRIHALESLAVPQIVRLHQKRDFDVLGLDERGCFALLQYREGDWVHTRRGKLPLVADRESAVAELMTALYRDPLTELPPLLLVPEIPAEVLALSAEWSHRCGHPVRVLRPQRGKGRALLRLAESNARAVRHEGSHLSWEKLSPLLGKAAACPAPAIVDCIDVSHLQGQHRVAAKVRFVEGKPERRQYRRYLVGGGTGNDDFAAMREVLGRVFARAKEEGLADLVVLDGGAGQLSSGLAAMREADQELPLVALAKARTGRGPVAAEERLFLPNRKTPFLLEPGSAERLFLERIRDEAHRFALAYHRNRRENVRLVLEEVPGVGPARRKTLLDFVQGKLDRLRDTETQELAALPGMNLLLAERVQNHLRQVLP